MQKDLAKKSNIYCFMQTLFMFGPADAAWKKELKDLANDYANFLRWGACLPQNGHDSNIYLLVLDERDYRLEGGHPNPVLNFVHISPFTQNVHIFGLADE